jgi:hypothetical protein
MRWHAAVATVLAAVLLPATGTARPFVLVSDDWGAYDDCTGEYDHTGWMLAAPATGRVVARGLDSAIHFAAFADTGTSVVWQAGREVAYGDLRTGAVRPLVRLARGASELGAAVGPHGRTAIVADDHLRVTLVGRSRGRIVRHTLPSGYDQDGELGLSSDGRFAWYEMRDLHVHAVRSVGTGRGLLLRTDEALTWAPAGDRLAYVQGDHLLVLDMRTRRNVLDMLLPTEFGLGAATWSPDGRFLAVDSFVVDVAAQRVVQLPAGADPFGWRPRHGHQLTRTDGNGDGDVVDVARATVLWRHARLNQLDWDPAGNWLAGNGKIVTGAGRQVSVPRLFTTLWRISGADWLAAGQLWFSGRRLRVAAPPSWHPRVVLTAPRGHHLTATTAFRASPAGVRMLEQRFAGRAHAADCTL